MRWLLGCCVLGTFAILRTTSEPESAAPRATNRNRAAPAQRPPPIPHPPEHVPDENASPAAPDPSKRASSAPPERVPPFAAMQGLSSVARGVIVDEAGAPVPSAKIRGMSWRGHRGFRRYGIEGYARDGIFVFRYRPVPPFLFGPPRADGTVPEPKLSFRVDAPGFVHELFTVEPRFADALGRGDTAEGMTIVLRRGAIVEGAVFQPDKTPCAEVEVGVVDDPYVRVAEYRSSGKTDAQGRFRLTGLDPRRTLWLHARTAGHLARPIPLEDLRADLVTQHSIVLEQVRKIDLRLKFDAVDPELELRIDGRRKHSLNNGSIRIRLGSGPRIFEFYDVHRDLVKKVGLWIEPYPAEQYHFVRLR